MSEEKEQTGFVLSSRLAVIRSAMRRRAIVSAFFQSSVCFLLIFVMLYGYGLCFGLHEGFAAVTGSVLLVILALYWIYKVYRASILARDLSSLALIVEKKRPEFMDSFACALQLEEASQTRQLYEVERELLDEISSQVLKEESILEEIFRPVMRKSVLAVMLIVSALCIFSGTKLESWMKFRLGLGDLLSGGQSGIQLEYFGSSIARHGDIQVKAKILRWEKSGKITYQFKSGEMQSYMMNKEGESSLFFTFYDLNEDVRFMVETPSLRTKWHRISVYDPPVYDAVRMEIAALEYTGRKGVEYDELRNVELVSGEELRVSVKTSAGVKARLGSGKETIEMVPKGDGWLECSANPRESGQWEMCLTSGDGHSSAFSFDVNVLPDMAPVIALNEPGADSQIKPGDSLRIISNAMDDFGLWAVKLLYSKNGGERQTVLLRENSHAPWEKEWETIKMWDLPALDVKAGDMLSCVLLVEDNCQPKHQSSRSDLFFVVVRPDAEDMEMDADGAGQNEKKADVSDLISESKRLLRLTWDTLSMPNGAERQRGAGELVVGLNELELMVRKRYVDLEKQAGGPIAEPLPSLFRRVSEELEAASRLVERSLFEESIQNQERGLSSLIAIETELIKNAIKSKKAQGKDGEGKSEGEPDKKEEQSEEQKNAKEQARQNLKDMKEALENLRKIIAKQDSLNGSIGRSDSLLNPLASKQEQIAAESESVKQKIEPIKEAVNAAASMGTAVSEMKSGVRAMRDDKRQPGGIHGARAKMQLAAAARSLEEAIRKAAASEVSRLAELANQLSEAQHQESKKSESAAKGEKTDSGDARERQNNINGMTGDLLKQAREAADGLSEDFPEVSKAMSEALSEAGKRGLQQSQTRAKNALLYRRYERASKEQADAGNYLKSLAHSMKAAADKLPAMSEQDMRDALEQLKKSAADIDSAMGEANREEAMKRIEKARREASGTIQNVASAAKNTQLQGISDDLSMPGGTESVGEFGQLSIQQIARAAATIGAMVDAVAAEKQKQLTRRMVPPPEKYRRQVEEYFKKIGLEK